ncbi:orotate phosphoribosyltransferase [Caproiciproducens sp. NJN-50]|uniref:phosphoribosyltransferase n=1 Tax=Acutalibacteraceae TaxID=3082771 RepID=UPI000FFE2B74|nr:MULTISPECIES: orotate phosphoribosyltransferase [Acutalibacteraceae]QAT49436.1 orotate phosphoribosyltransferase [Caproiciproducens sp. NJN-50]
MESRTIQVHCIHNREIVLNLIPGHFATSHSHVNYYIDMTGIKHKHKIAKLAAEVMAQKYVNTVAVDTIVCMDGCEVIGAFLAEELSKSGMSSMNVGTDLNVITPEFPNGQLLFRDNVQDMVWNKNILLLVASATTGKTINRSLECIRYYGGKIVGTSAIFSAISEISGVQVNSVFTSGDLPNYCTYPVLDCPYCKNGQKIDAIVNSYGYSKV